MSIYDSHDDLIWSCIHKGSCAHARQTVRGEFLCASVDNVSGTCDRQHCPLANAEYATIREIDGRLYLSTKVIERQHLPAELWERIELSNDYVTAYNQIKEELMYHPQHLRKAVLLRLKKYREMFDRRRKISKEIGGRVKTIKKKQERREVARQRHALRAAKVEKTVQLELMKQLEAGKYDKIYEDLGRLRGETQAKEFEHENEFEVALEKEKQL